MGQALGTAFHIFCLVYSSQYSCETGTFYYHLHIQLRQLRVWRDRMPSLRTPSWSRTELNFRLSPLGPVPITLCSEHKSTVFPTPVSAIQFVLAHQCLRMFLKPGSLYFPSAFSGNVTHSPLSIGRRAGTRVIWAQRTFLILLWIFCGNDTSIRDPWARSPTPGNIFLLSLRFLIYRREIMTLFL